MKWLTPLGWFMQTLTMMIPFIMGGCIGVLIVGKWPLLSFGIGTWLFWLFQKDSLQGWKKRNIIEFYNIHRRIF